jgi:hypothetical protein
MHCVSAYNEHSCHLQGSKSALIIKNNQKSKKKLTGPKKKFLLSLKQLTVSGSLSYLEASNSCRALSRSTSRLQMKLKSGISMQQCERRNKSKIERTTAALFR